MTTKTENPGLILSLKGAPGTPHTIVGLRGLYRPDTPTPIGGEGEVTVAEAKAAIEAGAPLELVSIPKGKLDAVRAEVEADLHEARLGVTAARKDGLQGAETGVLADQIDAVKEQ